MTLELSYASQYGQPKPFSGFGYTAAGVSASLLLVPVSAMTISTIGGIAMGRPGASMAAISMLQVMIAAQMILIVGIPAAGLALGIAGIATSRRRCVLAGLSAGFDAAMLVCLCFLPG